MEALEEVRWSKARLEVIARWRQIVERIDSCDEGGVLSLVNEMDAFCDAAAVERDAVAGAGRLAVSADGPQPLPHEPAAERCLFCRGFADTGGCLGTIGELSRVVLRGHWGAARSLAASHLARLEAMKFDGPLGHNSKRP